MSRLLSFCGQLMFWVTLPLLWVYFRLFPIRARVIVRHRGEVLLVQSWYGSGKWMLPGGGVHRHEAPLAAAVRELTEETGIASDSRQLTHLGSGKTSDYGCRYRFEAYELILDKKHRIKLQPYEIKDARWFTLQEAVDSQAVSPSARQILEWYGEA